MLKEPLYYMKKLGSSFLKILTIDEFKSSSTRNGTIDVSNASRFSCL